MARLARVVAVGEPHHLTQKRRRWPNCGRRRRRCRGIDRKVVACPRLSQRNPLKLPDLAPNRDRELSPISQALRYLAQRMWQRMPFQYRSASETGLEPNL